MKKYMFIVPSFGSGGAERAVVNLSSQLAIDGASVTVVIYFSMPNEYHIDSKVSVINLSGGDEAQYNRIPYLKKINKLRNIVKSEQPDYILPFLPQVTIHASLACFDMHKRIIYTLRNNPRFTPDNKVKRFICNMLICTSWKTIVQNERQRAFYPQIFQSKMHILFNPVSNELFSIQEKNSSRLKTIIGVGRLEKQKNFAMLIRAVGKILVEYPDVQLKIYGEGVERNNLQDLIDNLSLEEHVHLMGRSSDMLTVYQNADLYVLSSDFEGMPNTLIEAMAAGLPCIATNCETGPSDLIQDNCNGLLIDVGNEQQLVNAIQIMIKSPENAAVMGKRAKITVREKCGIESIAARLRDICNEL